MVQPVSALIQVYNGINWASTRVPFFCGGVCVKDRVEAQLGRVPMVSYWIEKVCPWGYPLVLGTHPYHGAIAPTLYWLSCPYLVKAVSRLEAEGLVGIYDERIKTDLKFKQLLEKAHKSYAEKRSAFIKDDAPLKKEVRKKLEESGIGGSEDRGGVKCLHMHLAHFLATGSNPVGEEVWSGLMPWTEKMCPKHCPPVPPHDLKPKAVIDAGSNTCRLSIAACFPSALKVPLIMKDDSGYWHEIYSLITTTNAGMEKESGRQKTFDAVKTYLSIIQDSGAELVKAVATGVWRRNKTEPPHDILEVIEGVREAEYSYRGVVNSLNLSGLVTVVDLGGGSVEVINGDGVEIINKASLDIGFWAVRDYLAKKGLLQREDRSSLLELTTEEITSIREYVKETLNKALVKIAGEMVLIGGTATTLAGLELGLQSYNKSLIHGYRLTLDNPLPRNLPLWAKDREMNIQLGAVILKTIGEFFGRNSALISDIGLMGGIFGNNS